MKPDVPRTVGILMCHLIGDFLFVPFEVFCSVFIFVAKAMAMFWTLYVDTFEDCVANADLGLVWGF